MARLLEKKERQREMSVRLSERIRREAKMREVTEKMNRSGSQEGEGRAE